MISQAEKRQSRLGRRAHPQLCQMHLAVYPHEVEFYSPPTFQTALYFEKNYQVIGQVKETIPAGHKSQVIQLTNIDNIINFRLCSQTNVLYKWSIYRRGDDGEQYLDSFSINLKQIVNNLPTPSIIRKSQVRSQSSNVKNSFIRKQMKVAFKKVDLCLSYYLFAASDELQIRQYIIRKFINKQEDAVIQQGLFLKTDSSMNIGLSSRKYPSNIIKKGSDPLGQHSSSNNNKAAMSSSSGFNSPGQPIPLQNSKIKKQKEEPIVKATTYENLQNIILNFDAAGTITESKQGQLQVDSDHLQNKQKIDPDMTFNDDSRTNTNEDGIKTNQATINTQSKRDQNLFSSRDYGMLKLQSDQGRIKQDPLDKKLQLIELQAIEEEKPSKQVTVNMSPMETGISPYKARMNKLKAKKKSTIVQQSQLAQLQSKKPNFKRMALIFIFSLLLFALAATLLKSKKKDKNRNKPRKTIK